MLFYYAFLRIRDWDGSREVTRNPNIIAVFISVCKLASRLLAEEFASFLLYGNKIVYDRFIGLVIYYGRDARTEYTTQYNPSLIIPLSP